MVKNKGFHIFLSILAASIFIFSLGKIIYYISGGQDFFFAEPNIFDWINSLTGALAAIILFTAEIKHIKNKEWYTLFFVAIIIFILNNIVTITDGVREIIQLGGSIYTTTSLSFDIFAIGFWIFSAWFSKRELNPQTQPPERAESIRQAL